MGTEDGSGTWDGSTAQDGCVTWRWEWYPGTGTLPGDGSMTWGWEDNLGVGPLLRDGSSTRGWEQYPGMEAAPGDGSSTWRWERYPGVGVVPRDGSSTREWEQYLGRAAVPRDGSGTQGWEQYLGMAAVPRDWSGTQGWSGTRGWERHTETAQASHEPNPSVPLRHGLQAPRAVMAEPTPRWVAPLKAPSSSSGSPGPQGGKCRHLGLTPRPGLWGRDGSSSKRAAARRGLDWRVPCALEGTSPGPDPRPASSKEPAAACQGDAGGSGLTWFLFSSPFSLRHPSGPAWPRCRASAKRADGFLWGRRNLAPGRRGWEPDTAHRPAARPTQHRQPRAPAMGRSVTPTEDGPGG